MVLLYHAALGSLLNGVSPPELTVRLFSSIRTHLGTGTRLTERS